MSPRKPEPTLLSWHPPGATFHMLEDAIDLLAQRGVRMKRVLLLVDQPPIPEAEDVERHARGARVEVVNLQLSDPTRHRRIYDLVREKVLPRLQDVDELHINVTPGTAAKHAVWLVLHAAGALPEGARLWSSQLDKTRNLRRIDPVDFEIRTYLADIRRVIRTRADVAAYDPEPRSEARKKAFEALGRYARVEGAPLLLLGERGTGKTRLVETHVARLKQREAVTVACGALEGADARLAESELFGHARGAFTGATSATPGLMEKAHKGILFLDEVQDLPRQLQRKLVRVLQDRRRRYRPVGATEEKEADVDIVCASNLSLEELRGRMDPDLFDRISLLTVEVPPLRACPEDLPEDWQQVWSELRRSQALPEQPPGSERLMEALRSSPLPGNLRDLQRLALLMMAWASSGPERAVEHALAEWRRWQEPAPASEDGFGSGNRDQRVRQFQARLAQWAKATYGTWTRAARELGCDERTLREDVKRA